MTMENLLVRFTEAAKESLGENLTGVYLHGSAAMGCFHQESSDLDLILVTEGRISNGAKLAFMERALALNAEAPAKGLEFSAALREACNPFVYPTPFELHFSNAHLRAYQEDPVRYIERMRGVDKDLAAHFTVIRAWGIALCGDAIPQVFGPVPRRDYLDSIWHDVEDACREIVRDPVYYTLNLCRVLAQAEAGLVLSKRDGGRWALGRLPEAHRSAAAAALRGYETGTAEKIPATTLSHFAEYMLSEIRKYYEEEQI